MASSAASAVSGLSAEAKLLLANGAKAEEMAQEILGRKRMLVELDRQRQDCTQALAILRDKKPPASSSSPSSSPLPSSLHAPPPSKLWVSLHSNFVRLPRGSVVDMLKADRDKLDQEINQMRGEMKERMRKLKQLQPALDLDKGLLDFALA